MTSDAWEWEGRSERWEEKVWGEVMHLFKSPDAAISLLRVKAGFRCSRHLHHHRTNAFIVLSGMFEVWEWINEDDLSISWDQPCRITRITPFLSSSLAVPVNRPHMFRVLESGLVVEIYTPDGGPVEIEDIVRFDEGGVDELA